MLNVTSEIGRLKAVLLHRPGKEIENLTPGVLDRLLFDDIPYLKVAQEEHDRFAEILKECGTNVFYLEDLAAESLEDYDVRRKFVNQFIEEIPCSSDYIRDALMEYFLSLSKKDMIKEMMAGVRREALGKHTQKSLGSIMELDYPLICDPMPNLYFTRDPSAVIGRGITLNNMRTKIRNRETIFAQYIFKYHPYFKNNNIPIWFDRTEKTSIEGGDELVLSKNIMAVGISQRTSHESAEKLAHTLLKSDENDIDTVLCFDIPKSRAFMHLDTVFTQIDYDKFTIHSAIESPMNVYELKLKMGSKTEITVKKEVDTLKHILSNHLNRDVKLIKCGGKDPIVSAREQWSDGSNTLSIAPGEVIVYERNYVTNNILDSNGIKIHMIPSSELSRGRGGPRCMSMPLSREEIV